MNIKLKESKGFINGVLSINGNQLNPIASGKEPMEYTIVAAWNE